MGKSKGKGKGRRRADATRGFDRLRLHSDEEAVSAVKKMKHSRFDESVDVVVRLGVDPRKADQMMRGTINLPSGTGKDVRVAVFAQGESATLARAAGAHKVGADDLAQEIMSGMLDFDVSIATPDMMRVVGRLGRILGPRGLMPNPKTGTITTDVAKAVADFKGGRVSYRVDKFANVHVPIGRASFDDEKLLENLRAVVSELRRAKPAAAKGRYMKKVVLSSSMGPAVRVNPADIG